MHRDTSVSAVGLCDRPPHEDAALGCTRFNVVGTSGSGKSSLARRIAESLNLPYVEMDELFWKPEWQESADGEFLSKLESATSADAWVLDGNYSRSVPVKWKRVQVVVWLDLPYALVIFRVVKRSLVRSLSGEVLWAGNRETFVKAFFRRDSVIWWSLTNLSRVRKRYAAAMADPRFAHIRFVRLKSNRQAKRFVESLTTEGAAG